MRATAIFGCAGMVAISTACSNRGTYPVSRPSSVNRSMIDRAPEGRARVVFVRDAVALSYPGRRAGRTPTWIRVFDGQRHVLGDLSNNSWFEVHVEPGLHEFYTWDDEHYAMSYDELVGPPTVTTICADLREGLSYFVRVVDGPGSGHALVAAPLPLDPTTAVRLEPIPDAVRGTERWAAEWLSGRVAEGHARVSRGECVRLSEGYGSREDLELQ